MPRMKSGEIYLDANATTPVLHVAAEEARDAMEDLYGNPSSSHITGLRARYILESTRELARAVLGATTGRIVFTSGATEAIETGIFSALCQRKKERQGKPHATAQESPRYLLYGATEHKAVPQALHHWNSLLDIGDAVVKIPVDHRGALDLDFLRAHVEKADIVCTMAVNNETGVIHDLAAVSAIIRSTTRPIPWLVDAVQAVGKVDLNLSATTIDYATISGHKMYAPKGVGMLYVRDEVPLFPLLAGGGQEGGARGGTENLPGVAAIGAVLRCLQQTDGAMFRSRQVLADFRDRLVASLQRAFPKIVFNTPFDTAVPTTINFAVQGLASKEILDLFDAAGIRVSSGSACGSAIQGSFVLEEMGLEKWRSDGAIRVSFGPATTMQEIDLACSRIEEAGRALCASCLVVSNDADEAGAPIDGLIQLKKGSMCSWLLLDAATKHCLIIDPFAELADRIESIVRCQKSRVLAILDTHQHVDHQSPRLLLAHILKSQLVDPVQPTDILGWPGQAPRQVTLGDGSQAPALPFAANTVVAKAALPGHTVDGQVFLVGSPDESGCLPAEAVRFAFSGDTLLIGGIGRTDFETSSAKQMLASLRKLSRIVNPGTIICPTHDYSNGFCTTLAQERATNGFLDRILCDEPPLPLVDFLAEKLQIDQEIDDASNCELVCGRIQTARSESSSIDIRPDELYDFFQQHRASRIIDVREPHEFRFAQDWQALGLVEVPENVPLTRLSDFLQSLLANRGAGERDLIFICRSGNRSGKAAEIVRRLGLHQAWHIAGGLAIGGCVLRAEDQMEMEYTI